MEKSDINLVNMLLQKSFTQARIDKGFRQTHVPMCRIDFLEMYFASCPKGCFIIENAGQLLAAAFCHIWGQTGWIGPLAVHPDKQLLGIGKQLLSSSVQFLQQSGCSIIGLEVNPYSARNLGFYSKQNFVPAGMSVDMLYRISPGESPEAEPNHKIIFYSTCRENERKLFLKHVVSLCQIVNPQVDYSVLVKSTFHFKYGDSILVLRHGIPIAFTTLHYVPSSSEEKKSIMRLVVFLAHPRTPEDYLKFFIQDLVYIAHQVSLNYILVRTLMENDRVFRPLIKLGFRVQHTDLRMTLKNYSPVHHIRYIQVDRWV
ncbi:GNAT family N-acetyltransferase [candidate division KSB1 bacterium]|nr:GNAT family N-acetyltransferase [candidate division KSB1 bacterium]